MHYELLTGWLSSSTPDLDCLLKVPFDYQPEAENQCFVYCVWMVMHYVKNKHPDEAVRKSTRTFSPEEIMDYLTIVEGGWRPDQDELTLISEKTRTIKFNLQYWQDGSPNELQDLLRKEISSGMPVIPFIDGLQLREGVRPHGRSERDARRGPPDVEPDEHRDR